MKLRLFLTVLAAAVSVLMFPSKAAAADHPHYLHALGDLRAARWLIEHRPGNWQQTAEEEDAVRQIDQSIDLIRKAAIDDGKDVNYHPVVEEKPDRDGRLHEALQYLDSAEKEVEQEEDNGFAEGLKDRARRHIATAMERTKAAIHSGDSGHPNYLHALADLRGARWLIENRPGDWQRTQQEIDAVAQIDQAIDSIKKASIDDGKDVNDHPVVDEKPDRSGRLHEALEFLEKARSDVSLEEDNIFANNLKDRALHHISAAIERTRLAINS